MGEDYQVIARRWRPRRFSELVGQEAIVKTLENAIRLNKIAHAFLFIGPKGTGKTSTARLLAMALNASNAPSITADPDQDPCRSIFEGNCMDVIEIDGASNNSVDQIRSLREECQYTPLTCRFKIYIIDEVHMLSQSAFNALLKTLEEPPLHVKFIFATTEAYKISPTIVSRCQRFEFKPISEEIIVQKLQQIAEQDHIEVEVLALQAIARLADGGMRDAQSIFEQMTSFGNNIVKERDVIEAYGLVSHADLSALIRYVKDTDYEGIVRWTERFQRCNFIAILSDIEKQLCANLRTLHGTLEIAKTLKFLDIIVSAKDSARSGNAPEVLFKVALFRAIEAQQQYTIDQVMTLLKDMNNTVTASDSTSINGKSRNNDMAEMQVETEEIGGDDPMHLESTEPLIVVVKKESDREDYLRDSQDTAIIDQLPKEAREKLSNLFYIEE